MSSCYNPYDLVPVDVDGVQTAGRPIELNGDIAKTTTMTDSAGNLVCPSKLSITCPKCGSGYIIPVSFYSVPFPVPQTSCAECNKGKVLEPMVDPWVVPHKVVATRSFKSELAKALTDDKCTVAERMAKRKPADEQVGPQRAAPKSAAAIDAETKQLRASMDTPVPDELVDVDLVPGAAYLDFVDDEPEIEREAVAITPDEVGTIDEELLGLLNEFNDDDLTADD